MSSEMREFREALQDCVRAMDVARDTIQPITTAQIRLHNLNPQTDKLLDDAAAKAVALLARTEAGAKCDHAWQPDSDVMNARYCPKCDVTQTIPKKTTHPQDASGDAENSRRYLKLKELFRARFHRSTCDYWVIEGECKTDPRFFGEDAEQLTLDAALDAMQAKEAK